MKIFYNITQQNRSFGTSEDPNPKKKTGLPLLIGFGFRFLLILCGVFVAAGISGSAIEYSGPGSLILVSFLLTFFNLLLRPVLVLFTLPFVLLTFGLGILLINAFLFYVAGALVGGFEVSSFWAALWGAFVVSLVSIFFQVFVSSGPTVGRGEKQQSTPPPGSVPDKDNVNRYRPGRDKDDVIDI